MPAESERQRKAAGAALAAKRGDMPMSALKGASRQMASSMSEQQLREFATKKENWVGKLKKRVKKELGK